MRQQLLDRRGEEIQKEVERIFSNLCRLETRLRKTAKELGISTASIPEEGARVYRIARLRTLIRRSTASKGTQATDD